MLPNNKNIFLLGCGGVKGEKNSVIFCVVWLSAFQFYTPAGMVKPMQTWRESRQTFARSLKRQISHTDRMSLNAVARWLVPSEIRQVAL